MGNILGALYLSMLFLGIINSRTVQPVAAAERAVRPSGTSMTYTQHALLPGLSDPLTLICPFVGLAVTL